MRGPKISKDNGDNNSHAGRKTGRISFLTLAGLSVSDLAHEYILTLCSALACAAVLAPLLIIFGMRYGVVDTMRHRLLEDPRNREVRPKFGQTFPREWFREMAKRNDVAFIVPNIRQIASEVEARRDDSKDAFIPVEMVPTDNRDPLLEENGARIPSPDECVLSSAAAAALTVNPGERIMVKIGRTRYSRFEDRKIPLRVLDVLPERAGTLSRIYLRLSVVEELEKFLDGLAVPRLNWEGDTGKAAPVYDGLLICGSDYPKLTERAGLTDGTGITEIADITPENTVSILGYPIPGNRRCIMAASSGAFLDDSSIRAVKPRLRERNHSIHQFVKPRDATLTSNDSGRETPVKIVSVPPDILKEMGISPADTTVPIAYISQESAGLSSPRLNVSEGKRPLSIPLTLHSVSSGSIPPGVLYVDLELGGQLNLLKDRSLEFDRETGVIKPLRRSYTSFRLYTRTLEDVVQATELFRANGIEVVTQAERIQGVTKLDRDLGMLFWLIAGVASIGGFFTMVTSLYASIERKRRDLGVLRLMGVPLRSLVVFPIVQGMVIVAIGSMISLGLYLIGSAAAGSLLAGHLDATEHLCRIRFSHIAATIGITQILAAGAGFLANLRLSRTDPSLILRSEQ